MGVKSLESVTVHLKWLESEGAKKRKEKGDKRR
ncbi:hypothetical protein C5S39_14420 [Candidatus Methanophagaceae archaeon]|nr:hypothetical protein C5S39_14420 [Methanophagales archaeon]